MSTRLRLTSAVVCVAMSAAGCSSGSAHRASSRAASRPAKASAAPVASSTLGVDAATEARCDPIGGPCMLPLPNDYFTVADASTPTEAPAGDPLGVAARRTRPACTSTSPIRTAADGWSPGSTMMVEIPGLDAARSKLPGLADASRSLAADSPIVVLDATTGKRHPFWAELDANADRGQTPVLLIHPAVNFADGHRIVVGLRGLVDGVRSRDRSDARVRRVPRRSAHDRHARSRRAGRRWSGSSPTSAGPGCGGATSRWRGTSPIASTQSLTGRMIAIRDDAFAAARERGAGVHGRQGHREPQSFRPAPDRGNVPDAALPHRRRKAGRAVRARRARPARAPSRARSRRRSCATCRPRRRPRPRAWRYTATACSATSPRSTAT